MLQLNSFFEGHRGAVISLAGNIEDKLFYSSGSEGLIVKWYVDKPNEGEVLLRLPGYVSCLAFDKEVKTLYAAINHKGVYVINAETGRVKESIEMPTSSFGALKLLKSHLAFSTKVGEVIVLEKATLKITTRISTGVKGFSQIAVGIHTLWYSKNDEIEHLDLTKSIEKATSIKIKENISSVELVDADLFALTDKSIFKINLKTFKKEKVLPISKTESFKFLLANSRTQSLYTLSVSNEIYQYKIEKRGLKFVDKTQFEHIGQINNLLWIENHRFVISAGADKKIGVWQLN